MAVGFGDGVWRGITLGYGDLGDVRGLFGIDYEPGDDIVYGGSKTIGELEGFLALGGAVAAEAGFSTWARRYPNAGGGGFGINIEVNGQVRNLIRFDLHEFKVGGELVSRPHIDIPSVVKHWPW